MPGKIKVKVLAGRNLPVMDRAGDTTDAFVEIKFGGVTHKTDVCRKSLNPHWNSTEWYRFEVEESDLQDEPLQLRLMDHDTYSANDAIGKVVISLAPLLAKEADNAKGGTAHHGGAVMSGWVPVFDTMHGIRGELNLIVKVELFSDFNRYKTSSVGVQFFHCPMIPPGYRANSIHGFVEELVVNDDPEYQWIDKIRTPRASNEARQVAFIKLSNQVQRLVGLKAAELGANAVIGYQQDFDLEGEAGVVARAIGTAVSITPIPTPSQPMTALPYTQQQLKKCLDILATSDENIPDLNEYYLTHQEELQKVITILNPKTPSLLDETDTVDDDEKSFEFARQSSVKTYAGNVSIYQDNYPTTKSLKHISEDQTDLNRLLNRDDRDYESIGPLKKIKKLRSSLFSKKRSRISPSGKQDDQISLQSNTSDNSRISLTDIRTEFKKFKRLKKPKLNKVVTNKEDEGVGMASILARSVIHAHTSLACITETQDSEHSPGSTLIRTSESEPNLNVSDEDGSTEIIADHPVVIKIEKKESKEKSPEIHFTSLGNINTEDKESYVPRRKVSVSCPVSPVASRINNFLKLPRETGYFGSDSSALSGESSTELYSSSDEDDESSGLKTDTEKSIERTSYEVQTVMSHNVDKKNIKEIDDKLSTFKNTTLGPKAKLLDDVKKETREQQNQSVKKFQLEKQELDNINKEIAENDVFNVNKPLESEIKNINANITAKSSSHFKFYNPFSHTKVNTSESVPLSPVEKKSFGFVHRSSNRIKQQFNKISNNSLIKSFSHCSLISKKKPVETKVSMSHPNSDSNIRSKSRSHETVLGTPFMSYSDLLSLDTRDKEDVIKPFRKSEDIIGAKVSMYIGSEPVSRASLSGHSSPGPFSEQKSFKKGMPAIKPTGLIHTAMETILIDKVQSLLLPTSPDTLSKEDKFFADVKEKLERVDEIRSDNGIKHLGEKLPNEKLNNDKKESDTPSKDDNNKSKKRLTRQQSVHSVTDSPDELSKMSEDSSIVIPCKVTHSTPVLQHFHPILSGAPKLETIPSLPESSVDRSLSLEVDEMERKSECDECKPSETNNASVCDNSHAGWPVDRSERDRDKSEKDKGSPRHARHESYGNREPVVNTTSAQNASLNATSTPTGIHRRSSDSDLSVTPKGGSLNTSIGNTVSGGGAILRPSMNSNNLDMLEYPFLTMTEYPPEFIVHLGGTVCARSVKLVDGGGESATRAAWWAELRTELRAHARALRCNAVIAYAESAAICEDVCVLSASGTAAVINLDCDFNADENANGSKNTIEEIEAEWCSVGHVPYSASSGPYRAELSPCGGCRRARVPAVMLATCAKPARLISYSKSVTLTAVAARVRRAPPSSEPGARDISDQLPYLEYELHKLLLAKLRMQGANALFSLQTQVAVGERCVMALASGTAVRLTALPPPNPPRIKATENDKEALEIQKALWETFAANRAANGYDVGVPEHNANGVLPEVEGEEAPALELCADKDACVLELDEAEDVETARALSLRRAHMPVYSGGGARPPPHAFAQVFRARLSVSGAASAHSAAERLVSRALDGITYKLRRLQPCALARPTFQLELPDDEIQLVVSGAAIRLQDPNKSESIGESHHSNGHSIHGSGTGDADDEIFALDEEQLVKSSQSDLVEQKSLNGQAPMTVSLTSLCYVSGSRTVRRVCALRLLFVRETTAVRELGGLSGFLHTFTCEVLGIARAYTAALGGNALTSFYVTQLMLQDNAHKNQGQCLLSVGGDVVHVTY